jgi:hypothetical protein
VAFVEVAFFAPSMVPEMRLLLVMSFIGWWTSREVGARSSSLDSPDSSHYSPNVEAGKAAKFAGKLDTVHDAAQNAVGHGLKDARHAVRNVGEVLLLCACE